MDLVSHLRVHAVAVPKGTGPDDRAVGEDLILQDRPRGPLPPERLPLRVEDNEPSLLGSRRKTEKKHAFTALAVPPVAELWEVGRQRRESAGRAPAGFATRLARRRLLNRR